MRSVMRRSGGWSGVLRRGLSTRTPGLVYKFGGVVYVALTDRCNAQLTMLAANGPNFTFPPGTIANNSTALNNYRSWHVTMAFPAGTGFCALGIEEPTGTAAAEAALAAVEELNAMPGESKVARQVVFAGLGEPLLRLNSLCEALKLLGVATRDTGRGILVAGTRLNTNGVCKQSSAVCENWSAGLVPRAEADVVASRLADSGLTACCVQVQTADPVQYGQLVGPSDGLTLDDVKALVSALLERGIDVECSVIGRPEVSIAAAQEMVQGLGAVFKVRPYFPA